MQPFRQRRELLAKQPEKEKVPNGTPPASDVEKQPSAPTPPSHQGNSSRDHNSNNGDDIILVELNGHNDPLDPKNWPLSRRARNIAIVALLIFCQAWAGGAESMANAAASEEFGVAPVAESLSTALYLFGIGSGALFAGPMSETFGRTATYIVPTFCYLLFVLGAALTPTFGGQLVCRYFVGLFSSATLAINGSSVRDQFHPVKRSFVFPLIAWANVVAPVLASMTSGFIVSNPRMGWRWTEWITLLLSFSAWLCVVLFLPETLAPLLLRWKAEGLRRQTRDNRYTSQKPDHESKKEKMKMVVLLPATFLFTEPVIAVLGSYLVLLYVLLFTFMSGFDYIFKKTYQLSTAGTGACFGSIAAGATAFTICAPWFYSAARRKTEYVKGAPVEPEFRLWPAIVTSPLLPIVLFWLGWTDYAQISMWSGLAACFIFGVVLIAIYVSSYEYIIDSYGEHSASALASVTMTRYLVAGGMVIAARPMYEGIGVHWTMTLLGCIATALAPAPALFWKFGRRLRKRSSYAKA